MKIGEVIRIDIPVVPLKADKVLEQAAGLKHVLIIGETETGEYKAISNIPGASKNLLLVKSVEKDLWERI